MDHYYNEHSYQRTIVVSPATVASNPDRVYIPVMGSHILGVGAWMHDSADEPNIQIRLMDEDNQFWPETGFLRLPTTHGIYLPVGYKVGGPGWLVQLQIVNMDAVNDGIFTFFLHTGDVYEMDIQVQILNALKDLAGRSDLEKVLPKRAEGVNLGE